MRRKTQRGQRRQEKMKPATMLLAFEVEGAQDVVEVVAFPGFLRKGMRSSIQLVCNSTRCSYVPLDREAPMEGVAHHTVSITRTLSKPRAGTNADSFYLSGYFKFRLQMQDNSVVLHPGVFSKA